MKFSQDYTVRWHDTNANRELTPSAILTLMQETTNKHIMTMYPYPEYIRDVLHQAFILTKVYIRIYEPVHAYDEITVNTWTGTESRGFTFYRSFEVIKDGRVVADALTNWCLVDTRDKKLLQVSKFENTFIDEPSLAVEIPRRIKVPEGAELSLVGERKIVYSDIDYNLHMNNTHYPNMLIDFLPSPEEHRVKEIVINFGAGSTYNESISVYRAQVENTFYFHTVNPDSKSGIDAIITTGTQSAEIQ